MKLVKTLSAALLLTVGLSQASAAVIYSDRGDFESQLGTFITDDYSDAGYLSGDKTDFASFDVFTNAGMSAVLGETQYTSTGFNDNNMILNQPSADPLYCAGCNGSFNLDFTSTSIGTALGVFGVGLDVMDSAQTVFGTIAFVTFGDGSTENYAIPENQDAFWGITSDLMISSIHFGLADGATNNDNTVQRMAMDNLTIGAVSVPNPATLALMVFGLVLLRRRAKR